MVKGSVVLTNVRVRIRVVSDMIAMNAWPRRISVPLFPEIFSHCQQDVVSRDFRDRLLIVSHHDSVYEIFAVTALCATKGSEFLDTAERLCPVLHCRRSAAYKGC